MRAATCELVIIIISSGITWNAMNFQWYYKQIDNGWIILIWVTLLSLINSRSVSSSERSSWTRTKILLGSKIFRKKNFCSSPSSPHLSNVKSNYSSTRETRCATSSRGHPSSRTEVRFFYRQTSSLSVTVHRLVSTRAPPIKIERTKRHVLVAWETVRRMCGAPSFASRGPLMSRMRRCNMRKHHGTNFRRWIACNGNNCWNECSGLIVIERGSSLKSILKWRVSLDLFIVNSNKCNFARGKRCVYHTCTSRSPRWINKNNGI